MAPTWPPKPSIADAIKHERVNRNTALRITSRGMKCSFTGLQAVVAQRLGFTSALQLADREWRYRDKSRLYNRVQEYKLHNRNDKETGEILNEAACNIVTLIYIISMLNM